MSKKASQRIRQRLFDENPHCHWCGELTINNQHGEQTPHGNDADNHATLYHLYSKLDGAARFLRADNKYVLACRRCNNTREAEKHRKMQALYGNRKFGFWFVYEKMLAEIMVAIAPYRT